MNSTLRWSIGNHRSVRRQSLQLNWWFLPSDERRWHSLRHLHMSLGCSKLGYQFRPHRTFAVEFDSDLPFRTGGQRTTRSAELSKCYTSCAQTATESCESYLVPHCGVSSRLYGRVMLPKSRMSAVDDISSRPTTLRNCSHGRTQLKEIAFAEGSSYPGHERNLFNLSLAKLHPACAAHE
jgi:hypothetical protein